MKKAVKVLSVILTVAALFGLVGGGMSLKDALGSKAYWENAAGGGDALGTLENGLNQLKENEQAYLDGRQALADGKVAYAEGQQALADGQKQYDEGMQTLDEKQAEYNAGVEKLADARDQLWKGRNDLAAGQAEYDAGQATLQQAKALLAGLGELQGGFASWQQGYAGLQQFQAIAGLPAPAADNAAVYDAAIDQTLTQIETGLGYCNQLDTLKEQKAQLEAAIEQMQAAGQDTSELETQLAMVNAGIAQIEAGLGGQTRESLTAQKKSLSQLVGVPQAVAAGQQQLAGGLATAINGVLGNPDMAAQLTAASGMSAAQLSGTVAAMPNMDYATFNAVMGQMMGLAAPLAAQVQQQVTEGEAKLAEGKATLDAGYDTYNAGLVQYYDGKQQLAEGAVLLEEGKQQLADAEQHLAEGKEALADAEKQLSDGEAQLAVFEDGRDQIIAGLEQVLAMEGYEGVPSIAERLGSDYSYMKNDTDLDIDKGLEAVAAARDFAADTTAAVTKEIMNKAVGAVLALAGSLLAGIGGVVGLVSKKTKGAGVIALLGAAAAVVGVVTSVNAGGTFSAIAGAANSSLPAIAGSVVGGVGLVQAITALFNKVPNVAK